MSALARSRALDGPRARIAIAAVVGIAVLLAVWRFASPYTVPAALVVGAVVVLESWRQVAALRRRSSARDRVGVSAGHVRFSLIVAGVVVLIAGAVVVWTLTAG